MKRLKEMGKMLGETLTKTKFLNGIGEAESPLKWRLRFFQTLRCGTELLDSQAMGNAGQETCKKARTCSICPFSWWKCPLQGQLEATHTMPSLTELQRETLLMSSQELVKQNTTYSGPRGHLPPKTLILLLKTWRQRRKVSRPHL